MNLLRKASAVAQASYRTAVASRVLSAIFFAVWIGGHSPFGYAADGDNTQVRKEIPNRGSSAQSNPSGNPTPTGNSPPARNTTTPAANTPTPAKSTTPAGNTNSAGSTTKTPSGSTPSVGNTATPAPGPSQASPVTPLKLRTAIGTNLAPVSYYSSQVPFVNVMKSASGWISGSGGTWDNQQPVDIDANGWVRSLAPGQIARTLMLRSIQNHYPGGRYLVRYKGQGTLKFDFAARVVSQTPGEIVIDVNPAIDGGVYLGIEATNPRDYVREIVVTMPGGICEGDPFTQVASAQNCGTRRFLSFADNSDSIIFNPVFLNRLRAYSVLRFMDWMATNNAQITNWSQRTPVS